MRIDQDPRDDKRPSKKVEELDAIQAYDAAKASGEEGIPLEEAIDEIERQS